MSDEYPCYWDGCPEAGTKDERIGAADVTFCLTHYHKYHQYGVPLETLLHTLRAQEMAQDWRYEYGLPGRRQGSQEGLLTWWRDALASAKRRLGLSDSNPVEQCLARFNPLDKRTSEPGGDEWSTYLGTISIGLVAGEGAVSTLYKVSRLAPKGDSMTLRDLVMEMYEHQEGSRFEWHIREMPDLAGPYPLEAWLHNQQREAERLVSEGLRHHSWRGVRVRTTLPAEVERHAPELVGQSVAITVCWGARTASARTYTAILLPIVSTTVQQALNGPYLVSNGDEPATLAPGFVVVPQEFNGHILAFDLTPADGSDLSDEQLAEALEATRKHREGLPWQGLPEVLARLCAEEATQGVHYRIPTSDAPDPLDLALFEKLLRAEGAAYPGGYASVKALLTPSTQPEVYDLAIAWPSGVTSHYGVRYAPGTVHAGEALPDLIERLLMEAPAACSEYRVPVAGRSEPLTLNQFVNELRAYGNRTRGSWREARGVLEALGGGEPGYMLAVSWANGVRTYHTITARPFGAGSDKPVKVGARKPLGDLLRALEAEERGSGVQYRTTGIGPRLDNFYTLGGLARYLRDEAGQSLYDQAEGMAVQVGSGYALQVLMPGQPPRHYDLGAWVPIGDMVYAPAGNCMHDEGCPKRDLRSFASINGLDLSACLGCGAIVQKIGTNWVEGSDPEDDSGLEPVYVRVGTASVRRG